MNWIKIFDSKIEVEQLFSQKKLIAIIINGNRICLAKLGENYFAIEDECPHRGGVLSQGVINYLGEVVCPLHAYRFHLKTGRECEMKTRDAKVYNLEWKDDALFIALEKSES